VNVDRVAGFDRCPGCSVRVDQAGEVELEAAMECCERRPVARRVLPAREAVEDVRGVKPVDPPEARFLAVRPRSIVALVGERERNRRVRGRAVGCVGSASREDAREEQVRVVDRSARAEEVGEVGAALVFDEQAASLLE
jgi:hypothetical protein